MAEVRSRPMAMAIEDGFVLPSLITDPDPAVAHHPLEGLLLGGPASAV